MPVSPLPEPPHPHMQKNVSSWGRNVMGYIAETTKFCQVIKSSVKKSKQKRQTFIHMDGCSLIPWLSEYILIVLCIWLQTLDMVVCSSRDHFPELHYNEFVFPEVSWLSVTKIMPLVFHIVEGSSAKMWHRKSHKIDERMMRTWKSQKSSKCSCFETFRFLWCKLVKWFLKNFKLKPKDTVGEKFVKVSQCISRRSWDCIYAPLSGPPQCLPLLHAIWVITCKVSHKWQ